jgi:uncharacterized protein (DUF58 family)
MQAGRDLEQTPETSIEAAPDRSNRRPESPAVQSLLALLGVLLLVGIVRTQAALVLLACLLAIAVVVSSTWSRRSTQRLTYRRFFEPPRIFPGEETDYVVEITNRKGLPLPWAEIEEHVPLALAPVSANGEPNERGWHRRRTVALGWHEKLILRQRFRCDVRGEYVIGPTEIETGDPLGIFPVRIRVPDTRSLVVYPRIAEIDWTALQSRFPFGPIRARPPVLEDPSWFAGVRDYRPGDPRKWVDWKATARRQQLQTRVFTPTTLTNLVVAVNMQTMPFAWQGYNEEKLDAAIGVAAALVRDLTSRQCAVGLAANASGGGIEQFQAYLPPSRRPAQVAEALAVLARLSALPTLAFSGFLRRVVANFPYGASLICVAAILDQETADQLSALADRGHAVALIFLGRELPVRLTRDIPVALMPEITFEPIQRDAPPVAAG